MARQWSGWRDFEPGKQRTPAPLTAKIETPGPGKGKTPGQSKFHNTPTDIGEIRFASKGEARLYQQLLYMRDVERSVVFFLRQVPFHLPGGVVYRLDFLVVCADGHTRYLDFKGAETPIFLLKKKQVEALYPVAIECIRWDRGQFVGL